MAPLSVSLINLIEQPRETLVLYVMRTSDVIPHTARVSRRTYIMANQSGFVRKRGIDEKFNKYLIYLQE